MGHDGKGDTGVEYKTKEEIDYGRNSYLYYVMMCM
jgi:hypothetical protein